MAARGKGLRRKTTLLSPRKWECVMLKWSNFELHNEYRVEQNRRQNNDFCQALLAALHAGTECCPVGVSTQAGTKKPIWNYPRWARAEA
jgi:hypothetical protein